MPAKKKDKETPVQEPQTQGNELMRRQSAPKPTVDQAIDQAAADQARTAAAGAPAVNGIDLINRPIGEKQIQEALQTLLKYKEGKTNLEQRVIADEQWYRGRHWEQMDKQSKNPERPGDVKPNSAWLFNCIANKHADSMDNYPSPNILPREPNDQVEAKMLTSIIPVILDACGFEETYSNVWDDKLIGGTGIYGIFWDASLNNGLGDISINEIDVLNLFWEPGITDIQASRNVFHVTLADNKALENAYPVLKNMTGGKTLQVSEYIYDDNVDTTDKSVVIDWYYRVQAGTRSILHYCKFVNDVVIFATENEPQKYPNGWYDHGRYPFIFDPLFRIKGSPCGFGYIDVGKDAQSYIDRGNQALLKAMLANAVPRYFVRADGGVNEEEFLDVDNDLVHVSGTLGNDSIMPVQKTQVSEIYMGILNSKIDELKETTGNRDISTGGTTSGVTAASAIAAMQEAGSKLSRDQIKASYRVYREIILDVIEMIRQFYDIPRTFRIVGERGIVEYLQYSNASIQAQGDQDSFRLPVFDVEVTAQKQSPYTKMAQNELALQFYGAGFFAPQMADQALACLDMMDFPRKETIMDRIAQNGGLYMQLVQTQQQLLALAEIVDRDRGTNLAEQIAAGINGTPAPAPVDGSFGQGLAIDKAAADTDTEKKGESSVTKKARMRTAESTNPG